MDLLLAPPSIDCATPLVDAFGAGRPDWHPWVKLPPEGIRLRSSRQSKCKYAALPTELRTEVKDTNTNSV